jgi:hypothetical protein
MLSELARYEQEQEARAGRRSRARPGVAKRARISSRATPVVPPKRSTAIIDTCKRHQKAYKTPRLPASASRANSDTREQEALTRRPVFALARRATLAPRITSTLMSVEALHSIDAQLGAFVDASVLLQTYVSADTRRQVARLSVRLPERHVASLPRMSASPELWQHDENKQAAACMSRVLVREWRYAWAAPATRE